MSTIHLDRAHTMGPVGAREAADRIAESLSRDYGMTCTWQDDVMHFARPGASGELAVSADRIVLDVRLGVLFAAFKPTVEAKLQSNFDRWFT